MSQSAVDYCLQLWQRAMDSPAVGLAVVIAAVVYCYLSLAKQSQHLLKGKASFSQRISEFSST